MEAAARELEPAEGLEGFEGFEAFEGAQTAGLNALQNRWQRHVVAVRVVALERLAEVFGGFEAGQTAKPGKRQS